MVEHLIKQNSKQKNQSSSSSFIGNATNALIISQIKSIREKFTILGIGITMLAYSGVLFLDYSAGLVAEKAKNAKRKLETKVKGITNKIEGVQDEISNKTIEMKSKMNDQLKESVLGKLWKNRKSIRDNSEKEKEKEKEKE